MAAGPAGTGNDNVTVDGTTGALALNVQGGSNNIFIGSENGGIDRIHGAVNLSGPGGTNFLRIDDRLTTAERILTHTIDATAYTRTGAAPVNLSNVYSFDLWAGSAADTINVRGRPTPLGGLGSFGILAGAGNDIVNVGNAANQLVTIGSVSVNGGTGTADTLNIYDQTSVAPNTYTFDFVLGDASLPYFTSNDVSLLYSTTFENLSLYGGSGSDTFQMKRLATATLLDGGGGNLLTGPNVSNRWQITGANAGLLNSNITFASMQNLTGGTNADTFLLGNGARIDGVIQGLGGINTLDYSAYPASPSIPGLVSWYRGEGDAADAVGGNNGTLVGAVEFAPGEVGQAFSLHDGSHVVVPNAPNLEPTTVSVEAWVNSTAVDQHNAYILAKGASTKRFFGFCLLNSGRYRL